MPEMLHAFAQMRSLPRFRKVSHSLKKGGVALELRLKRTFLGDRKSGTSDARFQRQACARQGHRSEEGRACIELLVHQKLVPDVHDHPRVEKQGDKKVGTQTCRDVGMADKRGERGGLGRLEARPQANLVHPRIPRKKRYAAGRRAKRVKVGIGWDSGTGSGGAERLR